MRDVPTLVWNQGKIQYKEHIITDTKLSSPYLTNECGKFFSSLNDFIDKLNEMLNNLTNFTPRQYALTNFTNKKSASIFLDIINTK